MNERYYVLDKFGEVFRALTSLVEAMPIKRQAIETYREKNNLEKAKDVYKELQTCHIKLLDCVTTAKLLFLETDLSEASDYAGNLYDAVNKFNLMAIDYTKLIKAITVLMEQIPKQETTNANVIGRLMNNLKMGYYPTDNEHIAIMQNAVEFPDIKVNVFDPCCGCGLALEKLVTGRKATTYGIEIDEYRGNEAEGRLDRVGFGSYFHSRISNEAFHMMLLNPPYLSVMTENGTNARHEKRFLVESMYKLMYGGLLLYIIPYYRLTADICRVLCDNFINLRVYRFGENEFSKFKQIVVFGIRQKKNDGSSLVQELIKCAMTPTEIPLLETITSGLYQLPNQEQKVEIFKGAKFNLGELKRQLKSSKSIEALFEKSKLDAMEKRPLLPLNVGQVGLIGGSGLINGYVDCDTPHIIKGRIVKEIKRYVSETDSTVTETRVNRMVFNILTPDGFRELA